MCKPFLVAVLLTLAMSLATGCAMPTVRVQNETGHTIRFELAMPSEQGLITHSPSPWRYEVTLPSDETWRSGASDRSRAGDHDWAGFSTGFRLRVRRIREVTTDRRGWVNYRIDRAGSATITIRYESDEFQVVAEE